MGLLNSILGAGSGKTDASGEANSLVGVLGGLLTQSGGLQGLANKFSQSGCGGTFASWVGMAKTSPSPAIKFKNAWVPTRSKRSRQKWGLIPTRHRTFWPNFCPKWWIN
jgi:uncharacterized protein YidB (DUF937 family)